MPLSRYSIFLKPQRTGFKCENQNIKLIMEMFLKSEGTVASPSLVLSSSLLDIPRDANMSHLGKGLLIWSFHSTYSYLCAKRKDT